jgi:hypothetical protein
VGPVEVLDLPVPVNDGHGDDIVRGGGQEARAMRSRLTSAHEGDRLDQGVLRSRKGGRERVRGGRNEWGRHCHIK